MYHGVYKKLNEFNPDIIWLHDVQFLDIFQVIKDIKDNYDDIKRIPFNDLFEIIDNSLSNLYQLTPTHLEFIKNHKKEVFYGLVLT